MIIQFGVMLQFCQEKRLRGKRNVCEEILLAERKRSMITRRPPQHGQAGAGASVMVVGWGSASLGVDAGRAILAARVPLANRP